MNGRSMFDCPMRAAPAWGLLFGMRILRGLVVECPKHLFGKYPTISCQERSRSGRTITLSTRIYKSQKLVCQRMRPAAVKELTARGAGVRGFVLEAAALLGEAREQRAKNGQDEHVSGG